MIEDTTPEDVVEMLNDIEITDNSVGMDLDGDGVVEEDEKIPVDKETSNIIRYIVIAAIVIGGVITALWKIGVINL